MFLRISKITIQPGLEEQYLRLHRYHANDFVRRQAGNLSVRLLRSHALPNQFFLWSWWVDRRACERVASSPRYAGVYEELMALLLERTEMWMFEVWPDARAPLGPAERLRVCGTPEPLDADACVRLTKMTVKPGSESDLLARFERWKRDHDADTGWLSGHVVRCESPPNTCFLQTWWSSLACAEAMATSPAYSETMRRAYPLLEQRLHTWTLRVVDEDDRCR